MRLEYFRKATIPKPGHVSKNDWAAVLNITKNATENNYRRATMKRMETYKNWAHRVRYRHSMSPLGIVTNRFHTFDPTELGPNSNNRTRQMLGAYIRAAKASRTKPRFGNPLWFLPKH